MIDDHLTTQNANGEKVVTYPASSAEVVRSWSLYGVRHALEVFETVFRAEMRETATYYVPPRGIYSTAALVDAADNSFPKAVLPYVPLKTREDWKAAGRCLAFSLLSASGFHVARAVEGTLEAYWRRFSGAAAAATLNSWHDYLKELDAIAAKKPNPAPAVKTLAELRQMKDDYRNPIMHPRVVLNEQDARMLFDNGESLIIAMADELREIAQMQGGVQQSFAAVGGS